MPKRTDLNSILIIGSGPIVIGQACEFDYSGTQACKVLKEEGYRVILVNSNPATIMTDPELADATYVEPIVPEFVERIIELLDQEIVVSDKVYIYYVENAEAAQLASTLVSVYGGESTIKTKEGLERVWDFSTTPLSLRDLLVSLGFGMIIFLAVESVKWIRQRQK